MNMAVFTNVLVVDEFCVEVTFYDENQEPIQTIETHPGNLIELVGDLEVHYQFS